MATDKALDTSSERQPHIKTPPLPDVQEVAAATKQVMRLVTGIGHTVKPQFSESLLIISTLTKSVVKQIPQLSELIVLSKDTIPVHSTFQSFLCLTLNLPSKNLLWMELLNNFDFM